MLSTALMLVLLAMLGGAVLLVAALGIAVAYGWGEATATMPPAIQPIELHRLKHRPVRDWLMTHVLVMGSLGYRPVATLLVDSIARPGKVVFAWFDHPDRAALGLLLASPHGRSVSFLTGRGSARRETSTGPPLSIRCREVVERHLRPDLTDPAALLAAHQSLTNAEESRAAASATPEELIQEIRGSYECVLEQDVAAGRRKVVGRRWPPTLKGRLTSVGQRLRDRLSMWRREMET